MPGREIEAGSIAFGEPEASVREKVSGFVKGFTLLKPELHQTYTLHCSLSRFEAKPRFTQQTLELCGVLVNELENSLVYQGYNYRAGASYFFKNAFELYLQEECYRNAALARGMETGELTLENKLVVSWPWFHGKRPRRVRLHLTSVINYLVKPKEENADNWEQGEKYMASFFTLALDDLYNDKRTFIT